MTLPLPSEGTSKAALAHVAVAIAVATWGCSNVVIKLTSVSGMVASFYRLSFALPLIWIVALSSKDARARLDANWAWHCLVGGILFSVHQVLFFNSLKLTSVANVAILGALQPMLVLLVAGPWFGESVGRREVGLSGLAIAGTVLAIAGAYGAPSWSPLGDSLAVANLFAFTAYFLWSKRVRASVGATEYIAGMTTVAAIIITLTCLATGQSLDSPAATDWPLLVFLALVPGTVGHFLSNWAHAHTTAFAMSVLFLAVPIVAAAGAFLVLDEALAPQQLLGGGLTLFAIAAMLRPAARPADTAAATT